MAQGQGAPVTTSPPPTATASAAKRRGRKPKPRSVDSQMEPGMVEEGTSDIEPDTEASAAEVREHSAKEGEEQACAESHEVEVLQDEGGPSLQAEKCEYLEVESETLAAEEESPLQECLPEQCIHDSEYIEVSIAVIVINRRKEWHYVAKEAK